MDPVKRWRITPELELKVRRRDLNCIYCGVAMLEAPLADGSRKTVGTWEHIINDERIVTPENIARCCWSCNSSKGTKALSIWIESKFCKRRGISWDTVADIVKQALTVAAFNATSTR